MPAAWFCELHRLTTTSDCPECDAEQVADLERYASLPACHTCKRTLREGESAWAADVKVIEPEGVRVVARYTCDDCTSLGCICDAFDIGPRCDYCVAKCSAAGHPDSVSPANGQNCMCGLVR